MHRINLILFLGGLTGILLPLPAYAGLFDNIPIIRDVAHVVEKIPVIGPVVKKVDDVAGDALTGVVNGVAQTVKGAGQVLTGLGKLVTGNKDGLKDIQDGVKTATTGAVLVATTGIVTVLAVADPVIGTLFFGAPSPLQGIAKFIYDRISAWKGKPACQPKKEVSRLMTVQKKTLGDGDKFAGALSTPFKYLSSIFDGYGAWEVTGCDAVGYGQPVRDAQLSTDGFWTADLKILYFEVKGERAKTPPDHYIRLEIIPGTAAHESASNHLLRPNDVVQFGGPMMWDKDKDDDHPSGHMEVHPYAELKFGQPTVPVSITVEGNGISPSAPAAPKGSAPSPPAPASGPTKYTVKKGDCLAKIAERVYGVQRWPWLFCTNRNIIRDPNLIYPMQELVLPSPEETTSIKGCVSVKRYEGTRRPMPAVARKSDTHGPIPSRAIR